MKKIDNNKKVARNDNQIKDESKKEDRVINLNFFDPLVKDVLIYAVEKGSVKLSEISEKFNIEYSRAKTICDQLLRVQYLGEIKEDLKRDVRISKKEIKNPVDAVLQKEVVVTIKDKNECTKEISYEDFDELLPEVLKLIVEVGSASINLLRRRFELGYARSARIIDQMEQAGFISGAQGLQGRSVLITKEQFEKLFPDKK